MPERGHLSNLIGLKSLSLAVIKSIKLIVVFSIFLIHTLQAQKVADSALYAKRSRVLLYTSSSIYVGGMFVLGQAWYKDNLSRKFVFFNDNAQWKQMDKVGHFYSSFHLAKAGAQASVWCGKDAERSYLLGSSLSTLAMLPIEVFDGFSADYGASWGDLVANSAGAFLVYGQYKLWKEIRITPKLSFHPTSYAPLRPNTLGSNLPEEILKDYNGHTLWLSVDTDKFFKSKHVPKWLNLAVGYGAEGMLYGRDSENLALTGSKPYRQYYLTVDFDFSHVRSKKAWVNSLLFIVNSIHIPAPAMEFNQRKGVIFHPLYF